MYFSEPILFELPVLPRVAKFVRVKLQGATGQPQPMLVTHTALGPSLMLWAMAQSEKIRLMTGYEKRSGRQGRRNGQPQMNAEAMTQTLGIAIHQFHYTRHQYLLNIPELWVFSNMVDHMILNELVQYCQAAPRTEPMKRIKQFCDKYDFDDNDFREDALKIFYWRYRNQTGAQSFAPEITRHFQFVPLAA